MARPGIAVFGSSEPGPEEPLYREAQALGKLLASAGFDVITGGYGGVMEGACRGARAADGRTIGVTCSLFNERRPNPYLTEIVETRDLHDRTRGLIDRAQGFVVLSGRAGTLAELAQLWALRRAGCLGPRPVVLLGSVWERLFRLLVENDLLEREQLQITHTVATPEEALERLLRSLRGALGRR